MQAEDTQWLTVEEMRQNLDGGHNPALLGLEPIKFFNQIKDLKEGEAWALGMGGGSGCGHGGRVRLWAWGQGKAVGIEGG